MTNVASQTSPFKGIEPQNHVLVKEQLRENFLENVPIQLLSCSSICPTGIQESKNDKLTTLNGVTTIPLLMITTPLIDEGLVRDEQTNEPYPPLTSTMVLERKQEMLYVLLDVENIWQMMPR